MTTSILQILSNLGNDYGDALKGSEDCCQIGPLCGMQMGMIFREKMKYMLLLAVTLLLLSDALGFLCLGVLSIITMITYTVGTCHYGYMRLGDLSVLILFGWLSVGGSYYL